MMTTETEDGSGVDLLPVDIAALMEGLDRQARARLQNRANQARFRARRRAERIALRTQKDALQPLSWHEVADALATSATDASDENGRLKEHRAANLVLVQAMAKWIATLLPRTPRRTAAYTSVLGDGAARQASFDWLTKRLYIDTDRALSTPPFPVASGFLNAFSIYDENDEDAIDSDDAGCVHACWSFQRCYDRPLHDVATKLPFPLVAVCPQRQSVCFLDQELLDSIAPGHMCYRRAVLNDGEAINLVGRIFHEATRVVFVLSNVIDDPTLFRDEYYRHRLFWYVAEAIAPQKTRVRARWFNSQYFTKDRRPVGFANEMAEAIDPSAIAANQGHRPATRAQYKAWLASTHAMPDAYWRNLSQLEAPRLDVQQFVDWRQG
ncbi:hypothetical protein SDRG_13281 [Saprolegnia diclina VS20]|uniref:Uncharacterized protein n=1 Tax=Saprolegnia diclina (strain VS20) TaxID=1156394 RepID=T0RA03_SAPDV|nr:hypothetical protein SDRG_13281 [Saprolegnia diclina VS20]EQC28943.1 hypothetical protein SDRG_13281 [Saprolegnia diclina VS20]|eukprot:XP_008617582.1 hypothetical protein SDRG_13281 [Saprolegnia diclina VS20]